MNLQRLLLIVTVFSLLGSFFSDDAHARRGKRWRGRSGKYCVHYPQPPLCPVAQKKVPIFVQSSLCQTLLQYSNCYYTIGYRSCNTNAHTRGAATKSAHLCGLAADIRDGTCGLGDKHEKGTAEHRHVQIGACPR